MAVIVTIRVDPITGKSELVGSRLNQASEIWASKGAKTRVAFISMGLNAGQFLFALALKSFVFDVWNGFESFKVDKKCFCKVLYSGLF